MPPRPVFNPLRNKDELQRERGVTDETLRMIEEDKSGPPSSYIKMKRTEENHIRAEKKINQMIQVLRDRRNMRFKFGGQEVESWEDAVKNTDVANWQGPTFRMILNFYADTSKPRRRATFNTTKIKARTLTKFAINMLGAYHRIAGRSMPGKIRQILLDEATALASKLPNPPQVRAELSPKSAIELMIALGSIKRSSRDRLAGMTYVAVACATGLRSSSLLRTKPGYERQRDRRSGARYGDLRVWVEKGPVSSKENTIRVYYKPRWSKTTLSADTWFPLVDRATLGTSATRLLLLSGHIDGVWEHGIDEILDPKYLEGHDGKRRLRVRKAGLAKYIFPRGKGEKSMTGDAMNTLLRAGSGVAGFALNVTTHCFRYLVAQAVFATQGFEAAADALQHDLSRCTTKTYLSRSLPFGLGSLLTGEGKANEDLLKIFKSFTRSDPNAPKSLTREDLDHIEADQELVAWREEQSQLRAEIATTHGRFADAPDEVKSRYKELSKKFHSRYAKLSVSRLARIRHDYHNGKGIPMNVDWAKVEDWMKAGGDTDNDIEDVSKILDAVIDSNQDSSMLEAQGEIGDREVRECLLSGPERCVELFDILHKVKPIRSLVPSKRKHADDEEEATEHDDDEDEDNEDEDDEDYDSLDEIIEPDEETSEDDQEEQPAEEWVTS